jgi:hypothetical protein
MRCFKATRTVLTHKLVDAASYKNVPQETLAMFVAQKSVVVNINLLLLSEFSDIRELKPNTSNTILVLLR